MTIAEKLPLVCPRCRSGLSESNAGSFDYKCEKCKVSYPAIDGVPWLFRYPDAVLAQWLSRWQQFRAQLSARSSKLDQYLKSELLAPTRVRLTQIQVALAHNIATLESILHPLLDRTPADGSNHLLEKVSWTQHFDSYFNNIFRDWGIIDENLASVNFVAPESQKIEGSVLILGSGAGRLAFDLQQRWQPEVMYSLDINPLLMLLQMQMFSGKSVELYELPRPPRDAEHVAVKRILKAPAMRSQNNALVPTQRAWHLLADARNVPLRDHCIDVLVTPWLIDIMPDRFDILARRWNRLLKIGGEWLIFGPLSYNTSSFHNDLTSLTETEIAATLESCGFQVSEVKSNRLPYLSSDAHSQKREETVWLFRVKKIRHEKEPPAENVLPEWIMHADRPIPVEPFLMDQLGTARLQAEAISLINGQNSLQTISMQLAARYGVPQNIALTSIQNLFSSLIETRFGSFR